MENCQHFWARSWRRDHVEKRLILAGKRRIWWFMQSDGLPKRTWCFWGEWYAWIRRLIIAYAMLLLNWQAPTARVDGDTPTISMHIQHFSCYQWVHFLDHNGKKAWLLVGSSKRNWKQLSPFDFAVNLMLSKSKVNGLLDRDKVDTAHFTTRERKSLMRRRRT